MAIEFFKYICVLNDIGGFNIYYGVILSTFRNALFHDFNTAGTSWLASFMEKVDKLGLSTFFITQFVKVFKKTEPDRYNNGDK